MRRALGLMLALGVMATGCDDTDPPADSGMMADAGMLMCGTGEMACDGACTDVSDDRDNCGACGTACGAGEACVSGSCEVSCPTGQSECSGSCVDTDVDRANCGACGTACAAGEICDTGSCELSCPTGQTVCGAACSNTQTDPTNCGACGTACAAGEVCSTGACAASCGTGLTECSGACVDTDNDPAYCGDCTTACAGDTSASGICTAGACRTVCDVGTSDCNADLGMTGGDGCETASATDVGNCGACGLVCSLADATAGCADSACTIVSCDTDYGNCDTMVSTGCETYLADDEMNCGACGTVCTAVTEVCVAGACVPYVAEDCSTAVALTTGLNTVAWTAFTNDYLTTDPSCIPSSYDATGPDLVLSYAATADGPVRIDVDVPSGSSQRWAMVVSSAACGTPTELACDSQLTTDELSVTFDATTGTTYYIYVVDTDSTSMGLSNPLLVTVTPAPCVPGAGGMVGTTITRVATGLSSFTEYYVFADEAASGYVYFGGPSNTYRIPKAGGTVLDIEAAASLGTTHQGYAMLVDGNNIYTLDSAETATGQLWQISADGGATWASPLVDWMTMSAAPEDDLHSITSYGGSFFMLTDEFSDTNPTQIWTVASTGSPPLAGTVAASFTGDEECSGIAVDDNYFYVGCWQSDSVLRVDRTTSAITALPTSYSWSLTRNEIVADDFDSDGTADVLYIQNGRETVEYICEPDGAAPWHGQLVTWGTGSSNYGLGFDRTANVLWAYDDDTQELIRIQ